MILSVFGRRTEFILWCSKNSFKMRIYSQQPSDLGIRPADKDIWTGTDKTLPFWLFKAQFQKLWIKIIRMTYIINYTLPIKSIVVLTNLEKSNILIVFKKHRKKGSYFFTLLCHQIIYFLVSWLSIIIKINTCLQIQTVNQGKIFSIQ